MNVNAVLNADMSTLRAWALSGFRWWIGQLRGLVPARWRESVEGQRAVALFEGADRFSYLRAGKRIAKPVQPQARVTLAIPEHFGLTRTLAVPRLGMADISRIVALEIERLMPLPPGETLVAIDPQPAGDDADGMLVAVAILPRSAAANAVEAATTAQLMPTKVSLLRAHAKAGRFDFAPMLRELGLLPSRRSPALLWWSIVGVAFLLNLILLIVRDQQAVDRIATLVNEQAPAVSAARTIASRARQFEVNADRLAEQRRSHDALGALGAVSAALPAGAWVQRYSWNGLTVRLTGYKRQGVDVLAALRRNPLFANVRSTNSDVIAEIATGQPFDITATARIPAR